MHKKNKLGIYVYPHDIYYINNISRSVNSISHNMLGSTLRIFRCIKYNNYGILLNKIYHNNVHKK